MAALGAAKIPDDQSMNGYWLHWVRALNCEFLHPTLKRDSPPSDFSENSILENDYKLELFLEKWFS